MPPRPRTILISTVPEDGHAFAVAHALRRKGACPILWFASDFPTQTRETIRFVDGGRSVHMSGTDMGFREADIDVVWDRRSAIGFSRDELHPSDQKFADRQALSFRDGLFSALAPSAFWVNPRRDRGQSDLKILQLHLAHELGFELPPTLITNDPDEIRAFLRDQGGEIVYKVVESASGWRASSTAVLPIFTRTLRAEQLVEDRLLQLVPGIYQARIPKAHELRVTMIGRRAFTARLLSQQTQYGALDFREADGDMRIEPDTLPAELERKCRQLMERLGIVFGCFDFIVTPDGRHVFLEVNPMGQFLWLELQAPIPLLDAFAEFLVQGRADYDWDPARAGVGALDLLKVVQDDIDRARPAHVPLRENFVPDEAPVT